MNIPKAKSKFSEELKHAPFFFRLVYKSSPLFTWGVLGLPPVLALVTWLQMGALRRFTEGMINTDAGTALQWGMVWFGCILVFHLTDLFQDYCSIQLRLFAQRYIESYAIERYSKLPFALLEDPHVRDTISAFQRNLGDIVQFIFNFALSLQNVAVALGLVIGLLFMPPPALIVLLATGIIRAWLSILMRNEGMTIHTLETKNGRRAAYYQNGLVEPRHNLLLRSLGMEGMFSGRWKEAVDEIAATKSALAKYNTRIRTLIQFVDIAGVAGSAYLCGLAWQAGALPASAFLVAITSGNRLLNQVAMMSKQYRELRRVGSILPMIAEINTFPEESTDGKSMPKQSAVIEFRDVHFSYPGTSNEVLKGISFVMREGERLALIGLNGAGKTTLLNLLLRIYEPTAGEIVVNGKPLSTISHKSWRASLAFLTQHVPIFDDTVEEQVRYGDYSIPFNKKRFEEAARTSGLDVVVSDFPAGMQTHAGRRFAGPEDKAIELSGGQNQITAIARTLYRDARFYIFDEPTSAVDAEKEERFFERLPSMLEGKGVIFVSHRFSTLRRAERILVMDNGKLIEQGSHEELMKLQGRYAELFALQAKAYQIENP